MQSLSLVRMPLEDPFGSAYRARRHYIVNSPMAALLLPLHLDNEVSAHLAGQRYSLARMLTPRPSIRCVAITADYAFHGLIDFGLLNSHTGVIVLCRSLHASSNIDCYGFLTQ